MRHPAKILIAEDDPDVLLVLRDRLESFGFDVTAVSNGREAVEQVGDGTYAIVLLDVMMSEMDGIEALDRIREIRAGLPVIMISANREKAVASLARGAQAYLVKPIDPGHLRDVVERWRLRA